MGISQQTLSPRKRFLSPLGVKDCTLWLRPDSGVYTGGCRTLVAGDKSHFRIADNASLSMGDIDFAIGGWVNFTSHSGTQTILSKWDSTTNNREFNITMADGLIGIQVSTDGISSAGGYAYRTLSSLGITAGQWFFFLAWHNATANTINFSVNGGTAHSVACAGVFNGVADFKVGGLDGYYASCSLADLFVTKRLLTSAEITFLINLGNGRTYAECGVPGDAGANLLTNLVSYWNCNETDPTTGLTDQHSTNDLTRTAAEMATNGAFTTDTGWTKGTGWTVDAGDSNVATSDASQSADSDLEQACTVVTGNTYTTVLKVSGRTAGNVCVVVGGTEGTDRATDNTFTQNITVASTNNKIAVRADADFAGNVDDFSVKSAAIAIGNGPAEAVARNTGSGSNLDGKFVGVSAAELITNYKSDVPTPLKSQGGYAFQLDGVNDYVQINALATSRAADTAGTLATWFNPDAIGSKEILVFGDSAALTWLDVTCETTTNKIVAECRIANAQKWVLKTDAAAVSVGAWTHIALSHDGTQPTILINGVAVAQAFALSVDKTVWLSKLTNRNTFTIGAWAANSTVAYFQAGKWDDVRYYSTALSAAQCLELTAGSEATGATPVLRIGFDEGPFGMPADGDAIWGWESQDSSRLQFVQGTAANRPVFVQQTAALNNKPSLYFDGVNDLLRCASAIGSSDTEGTVVMVILTSTDVLTEQAIFASSDEASATKFFRLGINNGGWRYNQNDAGTADTLDAGTAGASTAYLVVWQSDGSTINGEYGNYSMLLSETSGANNGDWLGDTSARDSTVIGGSNANNTPAKWFKGWIADVAYYSRKLTASELNKLKKYVKARYAI